VPAYIATVVKAAKFPATSLIDWSNEAVVSAIMHAMFQHENGPAPTAKAGITKPLVQDVMLRYNV
jgi:hypothetical protein